MGTAYPSKTVIRFLLLLKQGHRETMRQAALSLRKLTDAERKSIRAARVRVVEPRSGESLEQLSSRTGNRWSAEVTRAVNALDGNPAGPVKVLRAEPL